MSTVGWVLLTSYFVSASVLFVRGVVVMRRFLATNRRLADSLRSD